VSIKKGFLEVFYKVFPWLKDINEEDFPILSTLFSEKRFNVLQFLKIIEDEIGLGFYEGGEISVDKSMIPLIPREIASSYGIIPLRKDKDKVVVGVPFNTSSKILRAIEELIDSRIKPVYLPIKPIKEAIAKNYGEVETMDKILTVLDERRGVIPVKIDSLTASSSAEDWLRSLIAEAVKKRARRIDFIKSEEGIEVWINGEKGIERIASIPDSTYDLILKKVAFYFNIQFRDFSSPLSRRTKVLMKNKYLYLNIVNFPSVNSSILSLEIWDPSLISSEFAEAIKSVKDSLQVIEKLIKERKGVIFFLSGESSLEKSFIYEFLFFLRKEYKLKKIVSLEKEILSFVPFLHQFYYEPNLFLKTLNKAMEVQPEVLFLEIDDKKDLKSVLMYGSRTFLLVKPPFERLDELQIFLRESKLIPAIKAGVINGILISRVFKKICPNCNEEIEVPDELKDIGLEGELKINRGCYICTGEFSPFTFILDFIPANKDSPEHILLVKSKIADFALEKVKKGTVEMESFIDFILKTQDF
jgi:type II secretory ATPase GspE/PulE/Tfp pilus assembly ATPase PilB-like protein